MLTSEEKKSTRKHNTPYHHRWQPSLRHCPIPILAEPLEIVHVVVDVQDGGCEDADKQGHEGQVTRDRTPASNFFKCN